MNIKPVFIAGCDRSGTTMLGDILGSAEESFATPESQWVHEFLLMLQANGFTDALHAARWLRAQFRFAVWELDLSEQGLADLIDLKDARSSIENIIAAYLQQHDRSVDGAFWWCDHTPDNFKFYPLLKSCFPEARFIHIVRDGRAVFNSIRDLDWGPNNAYMGSRFWVERVQLALQVEMAEKGNCRRVRYEDILRNPEVLISELCDFTGQVYKEDLLDGGGVVLPGFTRGQHKLVGKRPEPSRIDSWRKHMSGAQISEFEAYPWTRVLMQTFDYPMDTTAPEKISVLRVLFRYVHESLKYMLNRLKHRGMEQRSLKK